MAVTTLSSREFNQDANRAKKVAGHTTVFITDRGKPAYVLMSIEEDRRLTGSHRKIADSVAMPGIEDIGFDPPRITIAISEADFF